MELVSIFFAGEENKRWELFFGDGGWGICFEEREMEGVLLMMRQGDGDGLMEFTGRETD